MEFSKQEPGLWAAEAEQVGSRTLSGMETEAQVSQEDNPASPSSLGPCNTEHHPREQPFPGPVANPTLWGESSPHSLGEYARHWGHRLCCVTRAPRPRALPSEGPTVG